MKKLAIRLKELREERGLSQMAAGTALGVSRSIIAGYETKGREPDVHMLITMADFYNVSMDYLVGRKDEIIILLTRAKKSIKIKMSQMCLRAHLKNGVITALARI